MDVPQIPGAGSAGRARPERESLPQLVLDNVKDVGLERSMGQVIPARVSFLMGNKAVLEINGRFVLADSQVPMSAGDRLLVRVRSYDGERAVLSLVDQKERPAGAPTMRQDLEGLLNRFGLKGTPQEKALATAMLEHGFGMDEGTLKAMLAASNDGNASPDQLKALMFARQYGIPISESTRAGVEAYLAGLPRMGEELGQVGKVLGALAKALEGLGVDLPEGVPTPPGQGAPVPGAPAQAPGTPAPVPGAPVPGTPAPVPGTPAQAPGAPVPLPGAAVPDAATPDTAAPGPAPAPLAGEVPPEGPDIVSPAIRTGAGEAPALAQLSPALPRGVTSEVFGLALSLRAAFSTGEAGPGFESARQLLEVLQTLQADLAAFTVGDQTGLESVRKAMLAVTSSTENLLMQAGAPPPSMEELLQSNLTPEELIAHLLDPEKAAAAGKAAETRLGEDPLLDLQRLRDALERLADDAGFVGRDNPAFRSLLESARSAGGLLDTQRMMNATGMQRDERGAQYLAVPFAMPGQPMPSPSEIRIYPPPRRKPGERHKLEDLKVSFYVNTARLGRMKIDMAYGAGALNFHFLVSSPDVRSYLQDRSGNLRKRLEEHDFKIGRLDLEVGEVPTIERKVERKAEMGEIKKLGKLDFRA